MGLGATTFRIFSPILVLAGSGGCGPQAEQGPVVLAAASTQEAVTSIAKAWEAEGHQRPVLSFAGTPAIARQVEQGGPADIVISADAQWMDWLAERDLIDTGSRTTIASNRLVYVWSDLHLKVPGGELAEVPDAARQIALADPETVPAGRYAKRALQAAGLWDEVAAKVVPTENVRAALALVERGEADLGVVYASDAKSATALLSAPLAGRVAIVYPAAMLTTSRNGEARNFLDFLASDEGAAIFCKHGFTMPQGRKPC